MASIDDFLSTVAARVSEELEEAGIPEERHFWVVVDDDLSVTLADVDEETHPDQLLASHIDSGATGAAFVTCGDGVVMAQVLVDHPRTSDIRSARIISDSGVAPRLGPWEHLV